MIIENLLTIFGCLLIALMLPLLYRAVVGPTTIDRMIGVNIIGTKTTILLLLIGLLFGRIDMFIDLALTYALLNFLASLAAARLLERLGHDTDYDVVLIDDLEDECPSA
jgi:multicomponent Na+:H+ antiporter subunit F